MDFLQAQDIFPQKPPAQRPKWPKHQPTIRFYRCKKKKEKKPGLLPWLQLRKKRGLGNEGKQWKKKLSWDLQTGGHDYLQKDRGLGGEKENKKNMKFSNGL